MPRSIIAAAGAALLLAGAALFAVGGRPSAESVAPLATPIASPTEAPGATATPVQTNAPIPDGYRIQIPRLAIDLPIAEGDIERDVVVQQTPENFAFHLPGTGIPGAGSNSYLYAHARRGMFLALWNARVGDEVFVSTPAGLALKYVVREIHPRVAPEDTSWIDPTPTERLTLQTSTGPNRTDPRFVVIATPA
jgi:LPXTG-site transpeptidase (sortase) family protein